MQNQNLGKAGEELAIAFLRRKQYEIIATNWKSHPYEIDIIATDKNTTVFVEVKTRNSDYNGFPENAVSKTKINHIKNAAAVYIEQKNISVCRIDVIAIVLEPNNEPAITHFEDVF